MNGEHESGDSLSLRERLDFANQVRALEPALFAPDGNLDKAEIRETVNHPAHYGGEDNPYEVIKIIEAHKLGFNLGNSVKYILRCDHKGTPLEDLKKGLWYLNREIANRERDNQPKS